MILRKRTESFKNGSQYISFQTTTSKTTTKRDLKSYKLLEAFLGTLSTSLTDNVSLKTLQPEKDYKSKLF